ncbi:P-loop containing nucleoside triphosphate hydrolase protein [Mycena metata]|uniref:P-loop containing nucleoside triphosphate hydrolase protein n=1 Tax=Mycena metata TaxID=1033252 RepID=A0AAD7I1S4_9AGAR|nr:P-loop containing nucleoside triphosphate hydrolase protein [Mycena metata]
MPPASSPNSEPSNPQQPTGKKKVSSKSKPDWLAPAILAARTITAAAECTPFPYIKGVCGTVVFLLETVENVKKNREDLKELCNTTAEIVAILHDHIVAYGATAAVKFKVLCEELESHLEAVILAVQNLHNPSKSFGKRVKEFMGSSNLKDEIAGYQTRIQGVYFKLKLLAAVDTNSKVNDMHAVIMAPSFVVTPSTQSINNCPPPSRIFQGRQTILAQMHQCFIPDSGKQCIYVLHGLGGAGKTQIALKFIQEASANFSDIFFVDASTSDTVETAFKSLALSKAVGDSAQNALTWLQSKHGDWLLFFDNADDPKMNLNKFFPLCNHGNIIVTSRNPGLRVYGKHSEISDMEEPDSVALLLRSAAAKTSEENLQVATKIVKELYYLPLAIAQAGAYISKSEDLVGYLTLYAENRARLLREKPQQSHDQYAWTVYTTWQISFDQLSKPAARFLQLCSFLHYTGITEDIFSKASKYTAPVWLPPKADLQEPLQFLSCFQEPTGEWSSLSFLDITNEIKGYSLISFDAAAKMFAIHPLVHAWSRSTLGDVDEESFRWSINSILGMCISKIPDHDMTLAFPKLLPHLGALSPFNAGGGPDFRAAFWHIYSAAGKLQEAHDLIVQVIERYKLLYGEQHLATLKVMQRLGLTSRKLGEYKKAKELEMVVLEKWTRILGPDHPDTLLAMGNLARTYFNLGDCHKAKELEMVVLEKQTKA